MQVNKLFYNSPVNNLFRVRTLNRFIWSVTFGLLLCFNSCVEKYDPNISEHDNLLVIDGSIIKGDSIQQVLISRSTGLAFPTFNPVSGCVVYITDRNLNEYKFEEVDDGKYTARINPEILNYENEFQLHVITPDNSEYVSEVEKIYESSPVDDIYFLEEERQISAEEYNLGLQFYVDLKAPEGATKNYMWKCEETWEIHTSYSIDGYWHKNDIELPEYEPKNSQMVCWQTEQINDGYTSSTENLTVNEKKKIPITFIPSFSPKINHRYSILVKQYALSEEAYKFHEQNLIEISIGGNLYETQPSQSRSNISNVTNPDERVLGYFWASAYSQERIFFDGPLSTVNDSHCDQIVRCEPPMGMTLIDYFRKLGKSVYLIGLQFDAVNKDSVTLWGYPYSQICIECTLEGGTTVKPDFW